jgi:hypothetical protein
VFCRHGERGVIVRKTARQNPTCPSRGGYGRTLESTSRGEAVPDRPTSWRHDISRFFQSIYSPRFSVPGTSSGRARHGRSARAWRCRIGAPPATPMANSAAAADIRVIGSSAETVFILTPGEFHMVPAGGQPRAPLCDAGPGRNRRQQRSNQGHASDEDIASDRYAIPCPLVVANSSQQLLLDFVDRPPDEVLVQLAMQRLSNRRGIIRPDHA